MKKISFIIIGLLAYSLSFGQELNHEDLKKMALELNNNPAKTALTNAISNNSIKKLALDQENKGKVNFFINNKVETKGITNQKSSGRCWMFTGLNVLRAKVITKYELESFTFSHTYLFFYDQLEKANLFYNGMIETAFLPLTDREVEWLLKNPIGDGGQWTGVVDLVSKYGLVPTSAMPETYQSENTAMMSKLIRRKLREDGLKLRELGKTKMSREMLMEMKNEKLAEIYQILAFSLGEPPLDFQWQYKGKDGKISEAKTFTPMEFFEEVIDINFDDYVMLMNDPGKEMNQLYEIRYDRHMQEGGNWKYINLEADQIKKFAIASIKDNEGMYFSCDVGKQLEAEKGYLDINTYDYANLFGVDFNMDKKQRIQTFESGSSHGMALMGVNILEDGSSDKWLLENSWGKKGHDGHLIMTDEWFDEFMFRLVIHKKYIDPKVLKILETEAELLPPWDPMFMMDK
ncbi:MULTISPECIES: C1 family peptidase [unclassified Lentimicrobium]|uniref:C1 family peptidase n=1 Tax=unclassified Lentimicrobium TaxID=2677434 RepID=UPI001553C224|nr:MULTISPECIES: C1 family peptidase [unclassified Lentimicrobium]NPD44426.1 C1 family peptidase [Lentimicrobium sp. S6]NPD84308.1 C1 family peptidase [Lentimicrobium sp. L6]